MPQVWFITGASRGLGLATAQEALARGHHVAATARDRDALAAALPAVNPKNLRCLTLDVTDASQVQQAVSDAVAAFGTIDVLVNNAGYGLVGAVEETSDSEARAVFDVNVFGLLTVTRAVLPTMRKHHGGTIINISSSGGFNGRAGWGLYCATKFAVEGITETLRHELEPLGIRATAVEPGGFRTAALGEASLRFAAGQFADYDPTAGQERHDAPARDGKQPGDPARGAAAIVDLADAAQLPERLQLGSDCFRGVQAKLERVADEQNTWRSVSTATDFDGDTD